MRNATLACAPQDCWPGRHPRRFAQSGRRSRNPCSATPKAMDSRFQKALTLWRRRRNERAVKIHVLDTRQLGHAGIVAATALETDDGIALFDTGPESTFENVVADLRKAGFEANDVRHVFLSHIHFDHA